MTLAGAGAAVFGVAFVLRLRYAANPLVPRTLLQLRSVTVGSGIFVLVGTILLATFYIVTLYLQDVRRLEPLEATLVYVPLPLAALVGTQIAPRLIAKSAPRDVLALGLVVQGISLGAWALTSTETGSLMTGLIARLLHGVLVTACRSSACSWSAPAASLDPRQVQPPASLPAHTKVVARWDSPPSPLSPQPPHGMSRPPTQSTPLRC